MGLATGSCEVEARSEEEAMLKLSLTTSDAAYDRNPLSPKGLRRFVGICGVSLPRRYLKDRLCHAALRLPTTRRNGAHQTSTTGC